MEIHDSKTRAASLLEEIDAFLSETGMGQSYFGKVAAGNSELVARLRDGGRVWFETEQKVRSFIGGYNPSSVAPSSAAAQPKGSLPSQKRGGAVSDVQGVQS